MTLTTNERLANLERMGRALHRKIDSLLIAANIELEMEFSQMADFSRLNANVTKLTDIAVSLKTMSDGLRAERDALKVELDTLKAADQLDQDAVDAAEASLATANATLAALTAVAVNTPVGGSVAGNLEPT